MGITTDTEIMRDFVRQNIFDGRQRTFDIYVIVNENACFVLNSGGSVYLSADFKINHEKNIYIGCPITKQYNIPGFATGVGRIKIF